MYVYVSNPFLYVFRFKNRYYDDFLHTNIFEVGLWVCFSMALI